LRVSFFFHTFAEVNNFKNLEAMKTILKITVLSAVLLMLAGVLVSCKSECRCQELMNASAGMCAPNSFISGLSEILLPDLDEHPWLSYRIEEGVFLIKGEVLDAIKQRGLKIKFIEDLKGNFLQSLNTLTVWGAGRYSYFFMSDNRLDWLTIDWKVGDTLLMLLAPVCKERVEATMNMCCIPAERRSQWIEGPGDFRTLSCTPSVVKLSGNSVFARQLLIDWEEKRYITEMPREEFDEILQRILNSRP